MSIGLRIRKVYHLMAFRLWDLLWMLLHTLPTTAMGLKLLFLTARKALFHLNRVDILCGLISDPTQNFAKGE